MTQKISKQNSNFIIDVINRVIKNYRKNSRLWELLTREEDIFFRQLITDVDRCLSHQDLYQNVEVISQDERDFITYYVKNVLKVF